MSRERCLPLAFYRHCKAFAALTVTNGQMLVQQSVMQAAALCPSIPRLRWHKSKIRVWDGGMYIRVRKSLAGRSQLSTFSLACNPRVYECQPFLTLLQSLILTPQWSLQHDNYSDLRVKHRLVFSVRSVSNVFFLSSVLFCVLSAVGVTVISLRLLL